MALRARLNPPRPERTQWPWHQAEWTALSASLLFGGDRRMEGEGYLAGGYGLRLRMQERNVGWVTLGQLANVWQPPRLKGIHVAPQYGTPFLAATQVFDLRPVPRKFLSLGRVRDPNSLFVKNGRILVTRSGSVGRVTLAHRPHENIVISDDLLRVAPERPEWWGWIYAFLRSPKARAMMIAAQYGHIIKHLEASHLGALPVPLLREGLLSEFGERVTAVLGDRNRAHALVEEAEGFLEAAIGPISTSVDPEMGFSLRASELWGGRRRLEGGFHTPAATAILQRYSELEFRVEPLSEVTKGVWWLTRFKRVFGDQGAPYMSADELFSLNPVITKHVLTEQATNVDQYFVKAGWIMMACSGQTYGINGSVALMTEQHENAFFSHDLIRIVPELDRIRPGYLYAVLGHRTLGRPLVIRNAYGTSIPHLEPADVSNIPVVRLGEDLENRIADKMEEASRLRAQADAAENLLAERADALIDRFLAGNTEHFALAYSGAQLGYAKPYNYC